MTAIELLKGGDLDGALQALQAEVRKAPQDPKLRVFLFQLLCAIGDWDRAMTQLRVSAQLDPIAMPMAQMYREAIGCEFVREKVFAGETQPLVFGEPAQWIAMLVESLGHLARGNAQASADLRAQAFEQAPTTSGTADGVAFEWLADADMRFGPVLELIMNGKYYWAPFASIRQIKIDEPKDLRDSVWTPVEITWATGGQVAGLVPTRYPGIETAPRDSLKLSRETEWVDVGADTFVGVGQRLFATEAADLPIMDVRTIVLDVELQAIAAPAEDGEEAPTGGLETDIRTVAGSAEPDKTDG